MTIASIYDAWLPDLVKNKLVAPAPDTVAAETKAAWPAGVVGAASVGGVLYGIPNEIDVYALNYNKKLGDRRAAEDLGRVPRRRKEADRQVEGTAGFGMINSWAAGVLHPFSSLVVSNGGDLVVDGKPVVRTPSRRRKPSSSMRR